MQGRGAVAPLSRAEAGGTPVRRRGRRRRPAGEGAGGRHGLLVTVVAAVVLALDQLTKSLAVADLRKGPVHLVGPLSLELTYNTGIAFGLGSGLGDLIVVGVVLLVGVLVLAARGARTRTRAVAFGLVLGGALGNLADRVLRGRHGAVVDFIHTGFWPTFNLADSAIVCGTALVALSLWRSGGRGSRG